MRKTAYVKEETNPEPRPTVRMVGPWGVNFTVDEETAAELRNADPRYAVLKGETDGSN